MRFSHFNVCFKALKDGFLGGCRPIIGVDGCHRKGPHRAILVTAVGVDPNNNLFPIAYAVVSKENRQNCSWFFTVLKQDLDIVSEYEHTFISDKQKVCATTVNEFKLMMAEMKALDQSAFDWFHDKPVEHWSRSHFNEHPKCDMLLNNICETFNSNILDTSEKPIITIIEWIREYLMKWFEVNRDRDEAKWKSRKKANVNSQPTAFNPQSSGTGMESNLDQNVPIQRTLLPPAHQAETEDEETMSHHLHMSRGTTSSNVPAQSVQNGLHPRVQIKALPPMNIQGVQFSTSMASNTAIFFNGAAHHYWRKEVCQCLKRSIYSSKPNKGKHRGQLEIGLTMQC
ncbi:hypothetical protein BUALT_Bualt06G0042600 [Buddleja alternifolia]|uniref:MULE transposase domain-containing protein n=1 Tax=Buddleja alternifolia TaxID=168488 RepID=A0AAV6XE03_9LAMI|nr:hypothetical protein BUALT_Bualt06G0042600 [Buddleja alternifolia]